jgi:surface protein
MFNVPSFFGFKSGTAEPFEFTINTANISAGGTLLDTQFKLPLSTSTGLNCTVEWGDGSSDIITNHLAPEVTHTYASSGTYTVKITGKLLGWQFNNTGDRLKMLNISKWAGLNISVNGGFWGCANLTASATDAPLITSTSLADYFRLCVNFNGELGTWNVSNVTNMQEMFFGASSFNKNIGAWNVSNVTNFLSMFFNATSFDNGGSDDINNWTFSTISTISMSQMFSGSTTGASCKFNRYIGSWDTQRVSNMSGMFALNTAFNQDIGAWDTSNLTIMQQMFERASAFNQDIGTKTINIGLPNEYVAWDVSGVSNMYNVFYFATSFNNGNSANINNWDVSNVTNMYYLFGGASVFNQPLDNWNTSNVTRMENVFTSASAFNQNIGAWNVSKVTNFENMFTNATAFNNGGSDDIDNWTFSTTSNINMSRMFSGTNTTLSCKFNRYIGSWNTQRVTNMSFMFIVNTAFNQNINTKIINAGLPNEYIAWNTSNVTQMAGMFHTASSFNGDIAAWNTSNVTNMNEMFQTASSFNQDISTKTLTLGSTTYTAWDVSKVTIMSIMFRNAVVFNQNIGNWDTSSVTAMNNMFQDIPAFNQDIGNWNVSNVTNFSNFMLGRTAANYSAANLDSIYNGWSSRPVKPNININFGSIKYTAAGQAGKDILTGAPNLWVIVDAGI